MIQKSRNTRKTPAQKADKKPPPTAHSLAVVMVGWAGFEMWHLHS